MHNDQRFKGAVHAITGGLAATTCLYNGLRCCQEDRCRRHQVNAVIYGALWMFEIYQTWLHWREG